MREITDHVISGEQSPLKIQAASDQGGKGGSNHHYLISGFDTASNPSTDWSGTKPLEIIFQNGPVKFYGVNGITDEVLLAVIIDRLRAADAFNATAFECCQKALAALQKHTYIETA
jgi:hypothetical protein